MTTRTRRIAIVCQPWDDVASQSGNSIVVVAYQLARGFASDWHVTIYVRRGSGQKRWEIDGEAIEFKRLKIFQKPQNLIETFLSILACYKKRRINYMLSTWYHLFYAFRVSLSIRASKCDVVLVHNFLQFASIIKLFNPSATICLSMHCEWLTQFATAASERRLRAVDLITGCSDYITEGIKTRFPTIAARCFTVHNGVDTDRFCPTSDVRAPNSGPARLLYVGRLSPEKGVHVLIQAFKILAESRPTLQLDLVDFVMKPRDRAVTQHVAQNQSGRRSAIDRRTTRHPGNAAAQRIRKRVEKPSAGPRRSPAYARCVIADCPRSIGDSPSPSLNDNRLAAAPRHSSPIFNTLPDAIATSGTEPSSPPRVKRASPSGYDRWCRAAAERLDAPAARRTR